MFQYKKVQPKFVALQKIKVPTKQAAADLSKEPIIPERLCFYELPDNLTSALLDQYDKYYAREYPDYSHRVRNRFIFRFANSLDRNWFLNKLEESAKESGLKVRRVLVFDY